MRIFVTLPIVCLVLLAVSGCAFSTAQALHQRGKEIIFGADVNLTEKSYAAADYLVQQAKSYINRFDVIKAVPLTNLDAPALSSQLALIIPAEVGRRFTQLGYRMDLSAVIPQADESYASAQETKINPHHILTGTYRVVSDGFQVNLRMYNSLTNHIYATFDYHIPRNSDIKKLSEPEAKIMIVTP